MLKPAPATFWNNVIDLLKEATLNPPQIPVFATAEEKNPTDTEAVAIVVKATDLFDMVGGVSLTEVTSFVRIGYLRRDTCSYPDRDYSPKSDYFRYLTRAEMIEGYLSEDDGVLVFQPKEWIQWFLSQPRHPTVIYPQPIDDDIPF